MAQEMRDGWADIHDARVLAAFAAVDRSLFVPPRYRRLAGRDAPLPIGFDQTISQPYVVAVMTQALNLMPGESVLEIGTGSGFQTAILCELTATGDAAKGATVYSVERFPVLAANAETRLRALGYAPHIVCGDGACGWPDGGSFDAILATAAPIALPRPLWMQLREGGRMVIPIGPADDQQLWLLQKEAQTIHRTRLGPVRFVPLISPVLNEPAGRIDFR